MTAARLALGRAVEERTAAWYVAQGYEVLDRNWRCREGELDLVVAHRRRRVLVVCEVKARRTDRFGTALDAVGWQKQARLRRLAAHWLRARGTQLHLGRCSIRFDVASWQGGVFTVVEGAF